MSNDQQGCCIIGACCGDDAYPVPTPPAVNPKQVAALATAMHENTRVAEDIAEDIAAYLLGRFDFAPRGSLWQLKEYVRKETLLHPVYNSGD